MANPYNSLASLNNAYDPYSDQLRQMESMQRMYEQARQKQYGDLASEQVKAADAAKQSIVKQDPVPNPVLLLIGDE